MKTVLSIDPSMQDVNVMEINLHQLHKNLSFIKNLLGKNTKMMSVIKGDAYCHGIIPIANEIELESDWFGVARILEAITVREAGVKIPILLLSPITPDIVPLAVDYHVTPMVDNEEIMGTLNQYGNRIDKVIKVHLKINTGLNRYGIMYTYTVNVMNTIRE